MQTSTGRVGILAGLRQLDREVISGRALGPWIRLIIDHPVKYVGAILATQLAFVALLQFVPAPNAVLWVAVPLFLVAMVAAAVVPIAAMVDVNERGMDGRWVGLVMFFSPMAGLIWWWWIRTQRGVPQQ